ncbi:MAG: hypothetical protein V4819_23030 [Verrucomicrobiota bacterium]
MTFKSVIALFMGLVIQLSQSQSCLATISAEPSGVTARPMCCCEGLQSCPCASDRSPDRKPAPQIPAAVDLKWILPKATGANSLDAPASPRAESGISIAPRAEARWAYPGVPLSVAFCSFVI